MVQVTQIYNRLPQECPVKQILSAVSCDVTMKERIDQHLGFCRQEFSRRKSIAYQDTAASQAIETNKSGE